MPGESFIAKDFTVDVASDFDIDVTSDVASNVSSDVASDVAVIEVTVSTCSPESLDAGVRSLLAALGREVLHLDTLEGGTTNTIIKCSTTGGLVLLVRIYGSGSEMLIDRAAEVANMVALSQAGLSGQPLATFTNGLVCSWVAGCPLTQQLVASRAVARLVAQAMARMHSLARDPTMEVLWPRLTRYIGLLPPGWALGGWSKQSLMLELEELKTDLEQSDSNLVLCHNDLNTPNIIYDGSKVSFIDVEYSGCSYAEFDVANHFLEFAGLDGVLDYERCYPGKEFQLWWIRTYLDSYSAALGRPEVGDERVVEFQGLVQRFRLCSHLLWAVWAELQAGMSKITFDFHSIAEQRLAEYRRIKMAMGMGKAPGSS